MMNRERLTNTTSPEFSCLVRAKEEQNGLSGSVENPLLLIKTRLGGEWLM